MPDEITRLETRRDELRRTVYGTADGHLGAAADELADVEARLALLRRAERADAAAAAVAPEAGAAARAVPAGTTGNLVVAVDGAQPSLPNDQREAGLDGRAAADADTAADDPDDAASAPPSNPARRRRRRLAALVAVPLAVLGIAAGLAPVRDALSPPAPQGVFARAQAEADRVPEVLLERWPRAVESSFRSIGTVSGFGFWAFSDVDGAVCMAVRRDESSGWSSRCLTEASFEVRGHLVIVPFARIAPDDRPDDMQPHEYLVVRWRSAETTVDWSIANVYQIAEITGESPA